MLTTSDTRAFLPDKQHLQVVQPSSSMIAAALACMLSGIVHTAPCLIAPYLPAGNGSCLVWHAVLQCAGLA